MFADVAEGSLDHNTREKVTRLGQAAYAGAEVERYKSFLSPREWWFLAYDRAGETVPGGAATGSSKSISSTAGAGSAASTSSSWTSSTSHAQLRPALPGL
jgi:hypothetical protein